MFLANVNTFCKKQDERCFGFCYGGTCLFIFMIIIASVMVSIKDDVCDCDQLKNVLSAPHNATQCTNINVPNTVIGAKCFENSDKGVKGCLNFFIVNMTTTNISVVPKECDTNIDLYQYIDIYKRRNELAVGMGAIVYIGSCYILTALIILCAKSFRDYYKEPENNLPDNPPPTPNYVPNEISLE